MFCSKPAFETFLSVAEDLQPNGAGDIETIEKAWKIRPLVSNCFEEIFNKHVKDINLTNLQNEYCQQIRKETSHELLDHPFYAPVEHSVHQSDIDSNWNYSEINNKYPNISANDSLDRIVQELELRIHSLETANIDLSSRVQVLEHVLKTNNMSGFLSTAPEMNNDEIDLNLFENIEQVINNVTKEKKNILGDFEVDQESMMKEEEEEEIEFTGTMTIHTPFMLAVKQFNEERMVMEKDEVESDEVEIHKENTSDQIEDKEETPVTPISVDSEPKDISQDVKDVDISSKKDISSSETINLEDENENQKESKEDDLFLKQAQESIMKVFQEKLGM
eukprot:TRINITY_DN3078_c5_g16_i1.p2 TRINITY_DN3078_c5_g16~~TRINITY_DN3078_c5_g16_i1.p2  ORF type:complete len:334 (-),score=123.75 TRINITY_DN3078_c5_g16_i1:1920-2921(-)